MLRHYPVLIACRNRLRTLQIATTGSTTLAVAGNTVTRATGSFITDGFVPGMEGVLSGFADNTPNVITEVTALGLKLLSTHANEGASAGRSVTVGLPPERAWEGIKKNPLDLRWLINEDYMPGPSPVRITAGIDTAEYDNYPMYIVKLLGLDNFGVEALYTVADGILALFKPYDTVGTVDSRPVLVRHDEAPYRGQALPTEPGRLEVAIVIPLRVRTFNS